MSDILREDPGRRMEPTTGTTPGSNPYARSRRWGWRIDADWIQAGPTDRAAGSKQSEGSDEFFVKNDTPGVRRRGRASPADAVGPHQTCKCPGWPCDYGEGGGGLPEALFV